MNKSKTNKKLPKKTRNTRKKHHLKKSGGIGIEAFLPLLKVLDYPVSGLTGSNQQNTMMNMFVYLLSANLLKKEDVKTKLNIKILPKIEQLIREKDKNSEIYKKIAEMNNSTRQTLITQVKQRDSYKDLFKECHNKADKGRQVVKLKLFHHHLYAKSSNPFGFKSDYDIYFENEKFTCCFKSNKLTSIQSLLPDELFKSIMNPSKSMYITDLMNIIYKNYKDNNEIYKRIAMLMKMKVQWNKRITNVPIIPMLPGIPGVGFEDFKLYSMVEEQYRSKDNVISKKGNKVLLDNSTTGVRKTASLSIFNKQVDIIKYLYNNNFIGDKSEEKKLTDEEKKRFASEESIKEIINLLNKNILDLYAEIRKDDSILSEESKNVKFVVYQLMTIIDS